MAVKLTYRCDELRTEIKQNSREVYNLLYSEFEGRESYVGQFTEMKANIMLAYRHLEDARMRLGKVLQAADDGVSILDKPPFIKSGKQL